MSRGKVAAGLVAIVAALAGASVAEAAPHVSRPIEVVPSAGLPSQVEVDRSNANLAVARYHHRIYMVFRTAIWQIADSNATLYVVSSRDQRHWRYEGSFNYQRDIREPRFLRWHKHLFLYWALLGTDPAGFDPGGTYVTKLRSTAKWTKPRHILQDDFIPWSLKTHDGKAYMTGYTGGGGTFQPNPPPKYVYFLTTKNGIKWRPVNPDRPVVYTGQCGETDFAFRLDGSLVTACQTEEVDDLGWGAKVCTAPASDITDWTCRGDTRRLDSPYVFTRGKSVWVVARRQPNFGGNYDLGIPNLPDTDAQFAAYDAAYAATTKRCSLWRINPTTREFDPVIDVPGWGDTCYPQLIRQRHGRSLLYNYTSPLDGSDEPWGTALTVDRTLIYRAILSFRGAPAG